MLITVISTAEARDLCGRWGRGVLKMVGHVNQVTEFPPPPPQQLLQLVLFTSLDFMKENLMLAIWDLSGTMVLNRPNAVTL